MKKNVINCDLTIPQYVKLVEQLNKENEVLKEQLKNVAITSTVVAETSAIVTETPAVVAETETTCTSCQGEKVERKPQMDPHWRPILQSLLKEQWILSAQIFKLTNAEEVLSYRIMIKKQNEYIATGLSDEDEQQNVSNLFCSNRTECSLKTLM